MNKDNPSSLGHGFHFLKVNFNGQEMLAVNNTLLPLDTKGAKVNNVPDDIIASLPLVTDDMSVETRLDNLAEMTVIHGTPIEIVSTTAMAIVASMGIRPNSEEGKVLYMSMPDRILEQPNSEAYILKALLLGAGVKL